MNVVSMVKPKRGQAGFSLVEMMIVMVVALVLLFALWQILSSVQVIDRTTSDESRMQETGRNALDLLGRVIRQAGSHSYNGSAFLGTPIAGTNGAGSDPDTITLQYEAQEGGEMDCTGANVASGAIMTFAMAVNTAGNPPALTCNGSVVVDNIEDMQITYGLDAARDGSIDSYITSPTAAEFLQVAVVRVELLVRGPSTDLAANQSQTYTFNGVTVTRTDGFLRQVYRATFTVRNQAG